MPLINPGIVANSPFLSDVFYRTRMTQEVNEKGRAIQTPASLKCRGIVTHAGGEDLKRNPDLQEADVVISVITRTQLQALTPGGSPDVITWAGGDYLVSKCYPYPRFGQGWYKVLATSQNRVNLPPSATNDY